MAYVISDACLDVTERACVEECPVDCIYEGSRRLYINPVECIDCGACAPACPVQAIAPATSHAGDRRHVDLNAAFFTNILPGRTAPVGNPGGAMKLGVVGTDLVLTQEPHT